MTWDNVTPVGRTVTYRITSYNGNPPSTVEYAVRAAKRRHAAYLNRDDGDGGAIPQDALDDLTARKMGTDDGAILVAVFEEA